MPTVGHGRSFATLDFTGTRQIKTIIHAFMRNALLQYTLRWTAVILLITGSFTSATMLAPDRAEGARVQAALVGLTAEDICGGKAGQQHHCPFCNLLPTAPGASEPERVTELRPVDQWRMVKQLKRDAQARDHARSPRAPPILS